MAAQYTIEELQSIITPIAQSHGVESVSLFGSYAKTTACPTSDVDLKRVNSDPCFSCLVSGWLLRTL